MADYNGYRMDADAAARPRVVAHGVVLVDGWPFDWALDEAADLEVWHWRWGQRYVTLEGEGATPDVAARRAALDLLCADGRSWLEDGRQAGREGEFVAS